MSVGEDVPGTADVVESSARDSDKKRRRQSDLKVFSAITVVVI